MTSVAPKVEIYFDLDETGGDFLTFDDAVRGELDEALYPLGGAEAAPTDITAYCYEIATRRGRARVLDEIQSGTCTIRLRNYDGRFLPATLNDPYQRGEDGEILYDESDEPLLIELPYGLDNIIPGKRVRVSVDDVPLFDGIVDDWSFTFEANGRVDAWFVASDALASLARKSFDEWTATSAQTAGPRLTAILDRSEVAFPSGSRDIDTGSSTLQGDLVTWGSNVLNYAQLVVKSELGRLFAAADGVLTFRERLSLVDAGVSAEFADDGSGIPFSGVAVSQSAELLYNRVGVDREGGTLQTTENAASIAKYGVRQLSLGGLLLDSDVQSADMADYLSGIYSEPQTRISALTVHLDDLEPDQLAAVIGLDLADVVQVTWTPTGASSEMVQLSVVEGVSHSTVFDSLHTVTLALSPLLQSEALVFDDVALGLVDSGVLAY